MIEESELYQNIDSTKSKIIKMYNKVFDQLEHLEFNCFNIDERLIDGNREGLEKYIVLKLEQLEETIKPVEYLFNKGDYTELGIEDLLVVLTQLEKMKKYNEEKYPALILNFNNNLGNAKAKSNQNGGPSKFDNNEDNNNSEDHETIDKEDREDNGYNQKLMKMFADTVVQLDQSSDISKYAKSQIRNYIANINYRLESIILDKEKLNEYVDDYNELVNTVIDNDDDYIEKYGDIDYVIPMLKKHGVEFDYTLLEDKTDLEIFDLVYDLSNKYNLVFE